MCAFLLQQVTFHEYNCAFLSSCLGEYVAWLPLMCKKSRLILVTLSMTFGLPVIKSIFCLPGESHFPTAPKLADGMDGIIM
jgi:hypothetical protein